MNTLRLPFGLVDLLDALVPPACAACDGPTRGPLCARCLESVESAEPNASLTAACLFGGPVADAIRRAKFQNDVHAACALGTLWVERAQQGLCALPDAMDAVAFVPAPFRRRFKRGFDLPAVLARALALHLRVPMLDALACVRADAPLSFGADSATRARAVAGRYRARRLVNGRVLLVDDVHTTGATLGEAARVLEDSGASVLKAALAYAP